MISAYQLAQMQSTAASALPDSGTIYRAGTVTNTGGLGGSADFSSVGTAACRVRPQGQVSPGDQSRAGGQTTIGYWLITFPAYTDVVKTDRVQTLGKTYEVIDAGPSSWEIDRQARCVEVG